MKILNLNQVGKLFRYNYEYFSLASTPHDEKCTPAGEDRQANILECQALEGQLRRMYGKQDRTELFILSNDHEFGMYYELAVMYEEKPEPGENATDEEWDQHDENPALAYAQQLEAGIPDKWDEEAIKFLEANGHPYHITKVVPMYRKTA